jgi:TPR repeat protein
MIASARLGHPVALGVCYLYGEAVPKADTIKAEELFRLAASANHPRGIVYSLAQRAIGCVSRTRSTCEHDNLIVCYLANRFSMQAAFT